MTFDVTTITAAARTDAETFLAENDNDCDDEDDIDSDRSIRWSFQRWLHEDLSWDELRSMVLHIHRDEYELLREMVRMQAPLPIPTHPRAIPFLPASSWGRSYYDRRDKPGHHHRSWQHNCRMLQFLPKHSSPGTRNGYSMDDQEAALLAMLMNGTTTSSNNNNLTRHSAPFRDKKKKIREEKKKTRTENRNNVASSYNVIARQFKSLESLDLCNSNTTYQQQNTDWMFLNSMVMEPTDDVNFYCCGLVESLYGNDVDRTNCDPKDYFLKQLKIVARGNFGSYPLLKSNPNDHTRMFPDWFDPEERWFTVSMYLACRLEVALWDAFHQQNFRHCSRKPSILFNPELGLGHHDIVASLLVKAMRDALRSILGDDRGTYFGDASKNPFQIRDCLLWYLLRHDTRPAHHLQGRHPILFQTWTNNVLACPILELGTKWEPFLRMIRDRLQMLASDYVVQSLVRDQLESDDTSVTNNTTTMQAKKKSSRKRNRSRKKKNKRTSDSAEIKVGILAHNSEDDPFGHVSMQTGTKSPSSSEDSEIDTCNSSSHSSKSNCPNYFYAFPDNNTSTRDRNRNIVMVLSILDDAIAKTFDLVGLNDLPKSKEYGTSALGSNGRDQEFLLVQCGGKSSEAVKKPSSIALKLSKDATHSVKVQNLAVKDLAQTIKPFSTQTSTSESIGIPKTASFPGPATAATVLCKREQHSDWTFDINDHTLFPSLHENESMGMEPGESFLSSLEPHRTHETENSATLRTSNLEMLPSSYPALDPSLFLRPDTFASSGWDMPGYSPVDGWGRFRGFPARDESIFTDFFRKQDTSNYVQAGVVMASSTAASIASSTDEIESDPDKLNDVELNLVVDETAGENDHSTISSSYHDRQKDTIPPEVKFEIEESELATLVSRKDGSESGSGFQSPSPPSTPSPRLSPILVSLSDLSAMRKEAIENIEIPSSRALSSESSPSILVAPQTAMQGSRVASSTLNNAPPDICKEKVDQDKNKSPKRPLDPALTYKAAASRPLRSSDDHDIRTKLCARKSIGASLSHQTVSARRDSKVSKDDHDIRHIAREQSTFTPSYKSMLARAVQTQTGRFSCPDSVSKSLSLAHFDAVLRNKAKDGNLCARSETALDGHDDSQRWSENRPCKTTDDDNCTMAKDGSTTITSASSRKDPEELILLKEERNAYRDVCLTLGAEVAKLTNLLATTSNPALQSQTQRTTVYGRTFGSSVVFDPDAVNHPFQQAPRAMTLAAMSDAGYRGEIESQTSEDEVGMKMISAGEQLSSGVTVAESDASVEIVNTKAVIQIPHGLRPVKDINDLVSMNGLQSRLARDIFLFVETTNNQLKKLESKRRIAVQRMTRLVNTIWPRAQVKLYGSHVTGICLPSSDLDFVVCLPAVHKNAVADAPGDLEGRNAINESSQKLLARRLKGESWIDPRSLKLIERTVVPIIKVSTKDTKAKTLHLDISFDAPHHHGLEAAHMISQVMEELPMIRPLVIVLKQFLLDRGLLTAYTGGLVSSLPESLFHLTFVC
jgi:hypothetical protein